MILGWRLDRNWSECCVESSAFFIFLKGYLSPQSSTASFYAPHSSLRLLFASTRLRATQRQVSVDTLEFDMKSIVSRKGYSLGSETPNNKPNVGSGNASNDTNG